MCEAGVIPMPDWLQEHCNETGKFDCFCFDVQNFSKEVHGQAQVTSIANGQLVLTSVKDPSVTVVYCHCMISRDVCQKFVSSSVNRTILFVLGYVQFEGHRLSLHCLSWLSWQSVYLSCLYASHVEGRARAKCVGLELVNFVIRCFWQ
jgi:hypothetical protein